MVAPFHDLQIGKQNRVVEGGGELTHAASGLLDNLAGFIGAGAFPAIGTGALAQGFVGREDFAGLEDGPVDLLGAKADVVFSVFGASGKAGGISLSALHILALQHLLGDGGLQLLHGDVDRFTGKRVGAQDRGCQRRSVDTFARRFIRVHKLIAVHSDSRVDGGRIQQISQIPHKAIHGFRVVARHRRDVLSGGDLGHLKHEVIIGHGRIPHEGEGRVDGFVDVDLQLNARRSLVHRVPGIIIGIGIAFRFGFYHVGVHGVVVIILLRLGSFGGESLDAFRGGGIHVDPVGQEQIDREGLIRQLLRHGGQRFLPGHTAHIHPIDACAGQHGVADDDGFNLLLMLLNDGVHLGGPHDDVGLAQCGGGLRRRGDGVAWESTRERRFLSAQQNGAQPAGQNQDAGTGAKDPIFLFSVQNAHRASLYHRNHFIGFYGDCYTFLPCFTTKLQICDV